MTSRQNINYFFKVSGFSISSFSLPFVTLDVKLEDLYSILQRRTWNGWSLNEIIESRPGCEKFAVEMGHPDTFFVFEWVKNIRTRNGLVKLGFSMTVIIMNILRCSMYYYCLEGNSSTNC